MGTRAAKDSSERGGCWVILIAFISADDAQAVAATAAILGTGGYFLYRWVHGFFVMNLAMDLVAIRARRDAETDHLALVVKLVKGDLGGTLRLHDAAARVEALDGGYSRVVELVETRRFLRNDETNPPRARLAISEFSEGQLRINMPPGDHLTLCAYLEVPAHRVCVVHAAVLGGVRRSRYGQWHASKVSLPIESPSRTEAATVEQ
jgi:hypothetical protein